MLELLVNYYELVAKITYGAEYLTNSKEPDSTTINRYNVLLNNIGVLHSKIKRIKEDKDLPIFNFNNIKKGNIYIENGFLVGNITKCRKEAYSLVADLKRESISEESLKEYELGLYALNLCSKVKESYIAPKSELHTIIESENNDKTLVKTSAEELAEDKDKREKKTGKQPDKTQKQGLDTTQFSMFSNLL